MKRRSCRSHFPPCFPVVNMQKGGSCMFTTNQLIFCHPHSLTEVSEALCSHCCIQSQVPPSRRQLMLYTTFYVEGQWTTGGTCVKPSYRQFLGLKLGGGILSFDFNLQARFPAFPKPAVPDHCSIKHATASSIFLPSLVEGHVACKTLDPYLPFSRRLLFRKLD